MNMSVKIAGVEFKNPVMEASGTFGSGMEYGEMIDLDRLGFKPSWRCCHKRCGKCAVAGKPDTKDRRDLRRHDQCHWSAEPGD